MSAEGAVYGGDAIPTGGWGGWWKMWLMWNFVVESVASWKIVVYLLVPQRYLAAYLVRESVQFVDSLGG